MGFGSRDAGRWRRRASAEVAYRRADAAGGAAGAFNLGVLLHQQREFAAAAAAYERAEQRGDRDAAFNLGVLLYEQADFEGAEAAWQRCLRHRHVQAAANLGFLLQRRGDLEGAHMARAAAERWAANQTLPSAVKAPSSISPHAELTYRLADAVGDAKGAFNLGVLLQQRRDVTAAAAAYERASSGRTVMPRSTSGSFSSTWATSMAPRLRGAGV